MRFFSLICLALTLTFTAGCDYKPEATISDVENCVKVVGKTPIPRGLARLSSVLVLRKANQSKVQLAEFQSDVYVTGGGHGCTYFTSNVPLSSVIGVDSLRITLEDGSELGGVITDFAEGHDEQFRAQLLFDFENPEPYDPGVYGATKAAALGTYLRALSPARMAQKPAVEDNRANKQVSSSGNLRSAGANASAGARRAI